MDTGGVGKVKESRDEQDSYTVMRRQYRRRMVELMQPLRQCHAIVAKVTNGHDPLPTEHEFRRMGDVHKEG